MNKIAITSAIGAFIVTVSTALVALFATEGVTSFADVSEVAYASAVLGGLVAAVTQYRARIAPSPSPQSPITPSPIAREALNASKDNLTFNRSKDS